MRVIQSAIALGVLAVSSGPAWPWGMDGHHTVGMIADIFLKNDPAGAAAQQLLGATLSEQRFGLIAQKVIATGRSLPTRRLCAG
jgi:hypothetical protein